MFEELTAARDKGLTVCISIASNPGTFGKSIHTAGYEILGLPFVYMPLRVEKNDLEKIVGFVRELPIRGCSVSMPHKVSVIAYLNALSKTADKIGAVNTVVNDQGRLTGDNTDALGAKAVLGKLGIGVSDSVILLGSGGAAAAVACALQDSAIKQVTFIARNQDAAKRLCKKFGGAAVLPWEEKDRKHADLLINATPIGFGECLDQSPIEDASMARYRKIFDLVPLQADTMLVRRAKEAAVPVAKGFDMAIEQSLAQFEIYTGKKAPRQEIMDRLTKTGVITETR